MKNNQDVHSDPALKFAWDAILRNLEAFDRNNAARIERLRQQATQTYLQAFMTVPVLLHLNRQGVPGFVDAEATPFGVRGFQQSVYAEIGRNCLPTKLADYQQLIQVHHPMVRALFLIGSPGTMGYTGASDLDYWICLDPADISPDAWEAYRRKLDIICAWIRIKLGVEVHFYPITREDLAANILRPSAKETEGEVAPLVVKEELYRTLLHVLGSRPLWWGAPSGMDQAAYQALGRDPAGLPIMKERDLIDFGFPHKPQPQEFLAAALWLSRKSEEDPFKGVLKMVLILEQVETGFQSPLITDIMKEKILAAGPEDLPVDPYTVIIQQVLACAVRYLPASLLDLVRIAVFFKIRGPLDPSESFLESDKAYSLKRLVTGWGWDRNKVDRLLEYATWPERDRLNLGKQFKQLIYILYTRVARRLLAEYSDQVTPDHESLGEFKARILARYSDHEATVEILPSSLDRITMPSEFTLVWTGRDWQLMSGEVKPFQVGLKKSKGQMVYRADRAARIAAWLVCNLIPISNAGEGLHFHASLCDRRSFLRLLNTLKALYPAFGVQQRDVKRGWASGAAGPRLIVINMEKPDERHLSEVDLIYRTKWGEMRHQGLQWNSDINLANRYRAVYDMVKESGDFQAEDITLFFHETPVGKKIGYTLGAVLTGQTGQKQDSAKGWLDIE